jgi:hypothetical protein
MKRFTGVYYSIAFFLVSVALGHAESRFTIIHKKEIQTKFPKFTLSLTIPHIFKVDNISNEAISELKSIIKREFRRERRSFLEEVRSFAEIESANTSYFRATLENELLANLLHPKLISIEAKFEVFVPYDSPTHFFKMFNYDLERGQLIELEDVLRKDKFLLGLQRISQIARNELKNKLIGDSLDRGVYEWILKGTMPTRNNFRDFAFTSHGLKIAFSEYLVACYADGPQEIVVPWEDLRDFVDDKYMFLVRH